MENLTSQHGDTKSFHQDEYDIQYLILQEQLKSLGNSWIGNDVELEKGVVVPPLQTINSVNIVVNKKNFPPIEINKSAFEILEWSTRSFLAQCGIEIIIPNIDALSDQKIKDINDGKNVLLPITIINHGQRAIELEGEVVRFFWVNDSENLRGEELKETIGEEINIIGTEGVEWSIENGYFGWNNEKLRETQSNFSGPVKDACIKLRLNNEKFYIPSSPDPLKIKSREELPSVLKEIPGNLEVPFKIRETPRIKLGPNLIGVINLAGYDNEKRQIYSPLIDPNWNASIKTETINDLDFIELFVYRK